MALKNFLKEMQDKWAEQSSAAKQQGDFENVPDGRYIAILSSAELTESKSSSRPMLAWGWTILEGDLEGEVIRSYRMLDYDNSFFWLAKELSTLGIDPEAVNIAKLEATLDELVESKIVARLKLQTKNEFQNVYVDRVLHDYYEDDDEPVAPPRRTRPEPVEEEAVAPKAKAKPGKAKPAPEPEPVEDEEEDEEEEVEDAEPFVETDAEDEEEVELQVGMKVEFIRQGKELEGTVTKIDEENGSATVKVGNKSYPVAFDVLSIVDEGTDG